jgi:hypothetical protein
MPINSSISFFVQTIPKNMPIIPVAFATDLVRALLGQMAQSQAFPADGLNRWGPR